MSICYQQKQTEGGGPVSKEVLEKRVNCLTEISL